ncbi:MAG: UbiA family prenyltransferase [Candidatus Diapherotrites archaeon]|nr:UbiA family prenyltransferase [Candidatus Diapherotrites archaeon]
MTKKLKRKKVAERIDKKAGEKNAKKKFSLVKRLGGFVELARPAEWGKSLLNMMVAMLMAFYAYNAQVSLQVFFAGFMSVAFLWSGLYTLNDYTDRKIDFLHKVKKNRAIPSGRVPPTQALLFSIILIFVSYSIAFRFDNLLVVCLTIMVINQLLYTVEPFRLKSRKVFDIISGSMINPIFRYASGLVLFVSPTALLSQPTPILPLLFVMGVQVSGYTLYRLFSKKHDIMIKMRSTVALVPEKLVKLYSYILLFIASASYMILFINFFTFKSAALGFLPPQYLFPILIVLIFLPLIKNAILDPVKANLKDQYRILYLMNIIFIFGNILVFVLAP